MEFKLPELGENIVDANVTKVLVAVGQTIVKDQPVLELETDKATIEVPATVGGVVREILVKEGEKAKVGQTVMNIEGDSAPAEEKPKKKGADKKKPVAAAAPAQAVAPKQATPSTSAPATQSEPATAKSNAPRDADFKIPELGENIESATVVNILVKAEDKVAKDQPLLELETDKATIEVPSPFAGTVIGIDVKTGDKVKVGQSVIRFAGVSDEEKPSAAPAHKPREETYTPRDHEVASLQRDAVAKQEEPRGDVPSSEAPQKRFKMDPSIRMAPAGPSVRRLAREIGIDINQVPGSGPRGHISITDVKKYARQLNAGRTAPAGPLTVFTGIPPLPDFSKWGEVERQPMSNIRLKTAQNMAVAWNMVPRVTQYDKADITELEEHRKRFSKKVETSGGKLTVTAVLLKVVASALKAFPQFNASIDMAKNEVVFKKYYHVGVAVDTDRGLLVPVVRDTDHKNILQLSVELAELAEKARNKKLSLDEMQGGSFTITNLGGIGGTGFSPIVNYPEVAILGVSRSNIEPVWMNEKFEPRLMLPISLSYDHRIIDGAAAARFLRWVADAMKDPFLLALEG